MEKKKTTNKAAWDQLSELITTRLEGAGTWPSSQPLAVREGVCDVGRSSAENADSFTAMTGNSEAKRGLAILINVALSFVEEPAEEGQKAQASPEQGRNYLNKT